MSSAMPKAKQALAEAEVKNARPPVRRRLSPELRRAQIMDAASRLIVRQGYLPVPIEALAQAADASKGLVYAYFPTQYELFNALLEREMRALALGGLETAARVNDLDQSILLCAMLYFEHVAQYGPLLHILITDLYMAGHIDPNVIREIKGMTRRLWRLARRALPLTAKEFEASLEMMTALPEEAGTLAYEKRMEPQAARELCHTLVLSSLRALRSPAEALLRAGYSP
jgi:AcrR family transcriptional regulator